MKTIMARTPHDSSFSFSRRYFIWKKKVEDEENDEEILTHESSSHSLSTVLQEERHEQLKSCVPTPFPSALAPKKKLQTAAVSKFRSALALFSKNRSSMPASLGPKVVGTLFGHRRGHVHIAFQDDPKSDPAFSIELSTPTSVLIREMASGLARVALECDKKVEKKGAKLLEEPLWRAYCNGKKCGYATRREAGPEEWKVLSAVGPITMGAGVLAGDGGEAGQAGEVMYMRAKFERVVGSKDSEAFYMMNPDGSGGPELSVYLLRV
ncbi:hypothetical protein Nepgr_003684 [Nepenthes gracilis]|uniref:Protein MIZU-KUSSEI 1 n=1 Tax=Nepenthes gracilis TaxID=150966 RepID=A0AAD3XE66_NEPGR|nr:hypothetical protein Nepgr_003684 [Nepenthes gracilis]